MSRIDAANLLAETASGSRRAAGLVLAELERGDDRVAAMMTALKPHLKGVGVIGITGPPGAGKSTLVNALIRAFRTGGFARVGIIAVDPSSPVSGGSILGDRLRMTAASDDDGVMVRSLSASGYIGGLTPSAARMIDGFDAIGFDLVIVETVGTGQNEIDVAQVADVRLVVAAPGLGDDVQAMKSGLLEIADLIVVNKADRPGAEQTRQQLAGAASLGVRNPPPVLAASAMTGAGIDDLVAALRERLTIATAVSSAERRARRARYLLLQSANRLFQSALANPTKAETIARTADRLIDGQIDTRTAVAALLDLD
jgi:LAO/AO transport system kinase